MISFLRKILNSWAVLGILGLVLAAFILTGVRDPLAGRGGDQTVAKIGGARLGASELLTEINNRIHQAQKQQPELTVASAVQQGADNEIREAMIQRLSLDELMRKFGVKAGTNAVSDMVAAEPAFQVAGKFDSKTYEALLRTNNLTPKQYEAQVSSSMAAQQVTAAVARGWKLPDSVLVNFASMLQQQRVGTLAQITLAQAGPPPAVDDVAVKAFYTKNSARYSSPELRSFRYFTLNLDSVSSSVNITDADIQKYYTEHAVEFGGIEERTLEQATLDSKAAAEALIAKIKSGGNFAETAKAMVPGLADADIARGITTEKDLAKDIKPDMAKAVFTLPANAISQPVETELGFQVFHVASIKAAKASALDAAARAQISQQLKKDKSIDKLADVSKQIDEAAVARKSFDALAKMANATPQSVQPLSRRGGTATGVADPNAITLQPMLKLAFDQRPGDPLSLQVIDDTHFAIVDVLSIVKSAPRALDSIKQVVVAEWQHEQQILKAKAAGDAILADVKKGKSLVELAKARGYAARSDIKLRWLDAERPDAKVPAPLLKLFQLKKGETTVVPSTDGNGVVVVRLDEILNQPADKNNALFLNLKIQVDRMNGTEAQAQIMIAARNDMGVSRNQNAIKQLHNQLVGNSN